MTVGIDYSMTCPAVCIYTPGSPKFWFAHASKYKSELQSVDVLALPTHMSVSRRAAYVGRKCAEWIVENAPDVRAVSIEDYAFNATGRVFHIGEHTGILKYFLDEMLMDICPVPPTVVKKYATGRGNADKPRMTAAFLNDYPAAQAWVTTFFPRFTKGSSPAKSPLADIADAYWIAKLAFERGLTKAQ